MDQLDRIEKQIDIDARAQKVWDLVTTPGWIINDGDGITDHEIDYEGDVAIVSDPQHGEFRFSTVALDPHSYASFRWITDDDSTLVEYFIEERGEGVTLRVVETGFATLSISAAERRARFDAHTEGWEKELALAKSHLTAASSTSARG